MSALVEALAALKQSGDIARITEAIPYAAFMGIGFEQVDAELLGRMRYSPMLIGNPVLPALHGGAIGALLETTAIFELMWEQQTIVVPKTISITLDFLRPGKAIDTWAAAVVTKRGRRVASMRAEAWQADRARPIAAAHAHFLIVSGTG